METKLRSLIVEMQAEANRWLENPNNFAQGVITVRWLELLLDMEKELKDRVIDSTPMVDTSIDEAYFQDDPNDTRLVTIVDGSLAGTLVPIACRMSNGDFVVINNVNYQLDGAALHQRAKPIYHVRDII